MIQGSGLGTRDTGHRVQDTGYRGVEEGLHLCDKNFDFPSLSQIVPIGSFYSICDRVLASGLNQKEEQQLFASLDPAGTGMVDWAEFRDAVWGIVHPVAQVQTFLDRPGPRVLSPEP